jgi:predicted acetyltransferase
LDVHRGGWNRRGVEMVNPVPVEEAHAWLTQVVSTLLGDPYGDEFNRRIERWLREWPEHTWGYRDNGRWVATLATEPRVLTIPGSGVTTRDLGVDTVTVVTVSATHRRRGLLTSMMRDSLQSAKDRGLPLSALIAAEWPIYGRFGYAPAVLDSSYVYHPRRPSAGLPAPKAGSVRQVAPAELIDVAPQIFDRARRQRAGQMDRPGQWWGRALNVGFEPVGKQAHWILHDGADGPDGVLAWRPSRDFDLTGAMGAIDVPVFVTATEDAYRDLWGYLAGIDVVDEIFLDDRPIDEPIRWQLKDGRALSYKATFDYLWVRLLDVPAALGARSYAAPGRVVLDVVDTDLGGYGAGRLELVVDDAGAAACEPTAQEPDLRIDQRALASAYLGGYRLRQLGHLVEELTPGALDRADLMFSTPLPPWNQTGF